MRILQFKTGLLFLLIFWSSISSNFAQVQFGDFGDTTSNFRMPIGYARIGEENFVGLRLQPELAFGKLGFGIDLPLMFNLEDGSLRTEEYRNGWFRLFRYVRYGIKERDPFYIRVGSLDRAYLGYGLLMNNYSNATSFERRKVGLTYDLRIAEIFGIEGTYSDFKDFNNIWAVRPYVRPLGKTDIPILNTLEIGFGLVTDHDKNTYDAEGDKIDTQYVKDGITGFSADMGVTIINTKMLNLMAYTQYAWLDKNDALNTAVDQLLADSLAAGNPFTSGPIADGYDAGGGFNIGVQARVNLILDVLHLSARLERLWYDEHFAPQFFDAIYEIDKDAKIWQLANTASVNGTYGVLTATILNKFNISGGLQIPDNVTEETPALIQLALKADEVIPKVVLQGQYIKGDLANLADALKLDERSLLTARLAYKVKPYLVAGVDYRWTFARVEDSNGDKKFEATSYVMPYVGLNFPLFSGKNK